MLKSLRSLESLGTLETLMGTIAAKPLLSHLSSFLFHLSSWKNFQLSNFNLLNVFCN